MELHASFMLLFRFILYTLMRLLPLPADRLELFCHELLLWSHIAWS